MKAVVYVSAYFPPDLGGTERVAEELAERMARHRRVIVLTSRTTRGLRERSSRPAGVDVRRLRALRIAKIPVMPGLVVALLRTPRQAPVHLHLGQAFVPELVWLVTRLRRQRLVVHYHLDIEPSGPLGAIFAVYKRRVLPRVLRSVGRVLCLTQEQADHLVEVVGVSRDRVVIVPNAVGDQFRLNAERRPDGPLRLLFVGRLSAQKNLPRLLDAVASVSVPVELAIVGDGLLREYVEGRMVEPGLGQVVLCGQLDGGDLLDRYRWADALVLTSDHEGMPLVLLEAMAAGVPIVANDVPGVRATVGDDAVVVPPTAPCVAAGIERLARDPELRAELAERGRRRAQRHSWDALVGDLEALYDDPSW